MRERGRDVRGGEGGKRTDLLGVAPVALRRGRLARGAPSVRRAPRGSSEERRRRAPGSLRTPPRAGRAPRARLALRAFCRAPMLRVSSACVPRGRRSSIDVAACTRAAAWRRRCCLPSRPACMLASGTRPTARYLCCAVLRWAASSLGLVARRAPRAGRGCCPRPRARRPPLRLTCARAGFKLCRRRHHAIQRHVLLSGAAASDSALCIHDYCASPCPCAARCMRAAAVPTASRLSALCTLRLLPAAAQSPPLPPRGPSPRCHSAWRWPLGMG